MVGEGEGLAAQGWAEKAGQHARWLGSTKLSFANQMSVSPGKCLHAAVKGNTTMLAGAIEAVAPFHGTVATTAHWKSST